MHNFNHKQKGVTLIEMMVALVLGVVIIFGATRSLSTMISSSRLQMGNNDMQQTADLAMSYIGTRLRNALATPCDQLNMLNNSGNLNVNTLEKTSGGTIKDYTTTVNTLLTGRGISVNSVNKSVGGQTVSTDNLTIASATERQPISGDTGMHSPTVTLSAAFADNSTDFDVYAITNCESMDVFMGKVEGTDKKTLTPYNDSDGSSTKTNFRENYRDLESSIVSRVSVSEIEVDADGGLRDDSIFRRSGGALMNDVDLLRVLFAVDSNGNDGIADRYISAKQLADLGTSDRVISAELFLLVKDSAPDKSAVPANYTIKVPKTNVDEADFNGDIYADANVDTLTFTDRVMRRLFVRTVTFRNSASL